MLLKTFSRPSVYLGILIVSWGIIMTLTGVVQNFAGLMVTRVLLGVFEYACSLQTIGPNSWADFKQGRFLPRGGLPLYPVVHAERLVYPSCLFLLC